MIGAGPVGSRFARNMAEQGVKTIVFEKKKRLDEAVCCTGIVSREFVEKFGISEDVIYRNANSASIFSPSGKLLHIERDKPQAAILNRPALNEYLGRYAIESGAEYRMNSNVVNIEKDARGVSVFVQSGHGPTETIRAKAVAITSGFGYRFTESAGFGRIRDFAMGVQAEVEAPELKEVHVFLGEKTAPGFFGWLVPTAPGRALAGLITRTKTAGFMKEFLEMLSNRGFIPRQEPSVSYAGVALRDMQRTSASRVMIIGSAAGQVKPLTGGGVYFGMMCADIAAQVLGQAFQTDDLTSKSLANYDKEWKKALGKEIKVGYWGRRFYEQLSDRYIETLFDVVVTSGIDRTLLASDDVTFDWHGSIVLKLLRYQTIAGIVQAIVNPLKKNK